MMSPSQLREFAMKVVFRLTPDDSFNLIDSPSASKIRANYAILSDEDDGTLEKFQPYGIPSMDFLQEVKLGLENYE